MWRLYFDSFFKNTKVASVLFLRGVSQVISLENRSTRKCYKRAFLTINNEIFIHSISPFFPHVSKRIEASNRHKLMSGIQSLTRTSESIARSQQIASETDAIGTDIIEDLSRQRDVLDRTKGRVSIVNTSKKLFNWVKAKKIVFFSTHWVWNVP